MLKNNSSNFTPVSNVFIEKYMPKARGEFIKVYLLMLKYNNSGEMGANSTILASSLNLLESDILNALNYWHDEGVLRLIPIDKMGNYNVEFIDLVEDSKSKNKEINLLEALNKTSTKDMLNDIERLLGRPLSPKEMTTYLSWQDEFNFSSELILILLEYCVSRGKSDYRYIEKVAIAWHDMNITTIDDAQKYKGVLTLSSKGKGKITSLNEFSCTNRTAKGVIAQKLDNDEKLNMICLVKEEEDNFNFLTDNTVVSLSSTDIPIQGRATSGNKLIDLKDKNVKVKVLGR